MKYANLNDSAANTNVEKRHQEMLAPPIPGNGSIEVWYACNPSFMADGPFLPLETHRRLGEVRYRPDWQTLYGPLQGDFWSPEGEANSLIRGLNLHHTSMSVGDVLVVNHPGGKQEAWMVAPSGWRLMQPNSGGNGD
jgi:hypothetical protein